MHTAERTVHTGVETVPTAVEPVHTAAEAVPAVVDASHEGAVNIAAVSGSPGKLRIDGARIRAIRTTKMMTIPQLASKAGIAVRTLADLECGRTSGGRADTIRCIAGALAIAPEELLVKAATAAALATSATSATPAAPPAAHSPIPIPPPKLPPRTRLDSLADLVRTRGLSSPPVTIGKTTFTVLDPVVMQNLFARHAAFDGESFVVCGRIERQRALSVAEARALKTRVGVGARYGLVVEVAAGETLDVTVHAVDAAVAAALQAKMGQAARVVVRVRVVGDGTSPVRPGRGPHQEEEARVVSLFASARKRAWALVAVKMG